jgi:hypothetical protein
VEYIEKYASACRTANEGTQGTASITLAQGASESGAGQSALARKSNNHFGIKCGSNWRGRTVRHDDDAAMNVLVLQQSSGILFEITPLSEIGVRVTLSCLI